MEAKPITLEQIRQKVLDRHDMPTDIYIGHLECALRACKERLRYIRNRSADRPLVSKDLSEIFVVEGGIQGMIDKLKELVPDPKQEGKNETQ